MNTTQLVKTILAFTLSGLFGSSTAIGQDVRARDLGIPFEGVPGPLNAITDVHDIEVGHTGLSPVW